MIGLAIASAIGIGAIVVTALILPCPACKYRRERMRAAIAAWRRRKNGQSET